MAKSAALNRLPDTGYARSAGLGDLSRRTVPREATSPSLFLLDFGSFASTTLVRFLPLEGLPFRPDLHDLHPGHLT